MAWRQWAMVSRVEQKLAVSSLSYCEVGGGRGASTRGSNYCNAGAFRSRAGRGFILLGENFFFFSGKKRGKRKKKNVIGSFFFYFS